MEINICFVHNSNIMRYQGVPASGVLQVTCTSLSVKNVKPTYRHYGYKDIASACADILDTCGGKSTTDCIVQQDSSIRNVINVLQYHVPTTIPLCIITDKTVYEDVYVHTMMCTNINNTEVVLFKDGNDDCIIYPESILEIRTSNSYTGFVELIEQHNNNDYAAPVKKPKRTRLDVRIAAYDDIEKKLKAPVYTTVMTEDYE